MALQSTGALSVSDIETKSKLNTVANVSKSLSNDLYPLIGGTSGSNVSFSTFRGKYCDVVDYMFRVQYKSSTALPSTSFTDLTGNTTVTNNISAANNSKVTTYNDTVRGYVFNLSGTNYLSVSVATPTTFTRTLWVKSSSRNVNSGNVFSSYLFPIWFSSSIYLGYSPDWNSGNHRYADATDEGTGWVFYCFTSNSTSQAMYVNGNSTAVATSSIAWSGDPTSNLTTMPISFGAYLNVNNFTGYLDDMRMYNYVLTTNQMKGIYDSTKKV